jgi:transposase
MAVIRTQQAMIEELRAEVRQLREENRELRARLSRDSSNSSQPPSSDPPWKAPSERKQGRKRGGQPGHRGHRRELVEPDEVVDHRPAACAHCCGPLVGDDPEPSRHQVTEVPPVVAVVTEHRVHTLRCGQCGKHTVALLPADVPCSSFGPRLQSIIAMCSGAYRLSKRTIVELMRDFFGVAISLGSIANVEQQMSRALAASVAEAHAHVKNARVVHVDETGWFVRSLRAWLWTAVTARVAVFMIRKSRSRETSLELLPQTFRGVTVADGYQVYDWIHPERRQLCWAHLLRNFRGLLEYGDVAKAFGERILHAIGRLFERWHAVRGETRARTIAEVDIALAPSRDEIHALLDEGSRSESAKVRRICNWLLRREASLWTFVRRHGVEPTNNAAERALRPAVLWRKGSFGTDSENGSRFVERILTVVSSLRLQGRHVLAYLTQASRQALLAAPAPPIWVEA